MKKQILVALCILGAAVVANAGPLPGTGVEKSVHDMNSLSYTTKDDQGRVCAFCHTPHHAIDTTVATQSTYLPLWSHTPNTATNFTAYGTGDGNIPFSPTLNLVYESDILVGPSRLCMSCHDGLIAVDQHYSTAGTTTLNSDVFGKAGIASNDSLSNDHPIGFNYNTVAGAIIKGTANPTPSGTADGYINPATSLYGTDTTPNTNAPALKISDRLYNGIMTCATCHDVHNRRNANNANQLVNKLVLAPQENSALCQTCHIK